MDYLWCFLCGGLLCAVGQVLIDLTKLTPARILSGYVVAVEEKGLLGVLAGGLTATAGGIAAAVVFALIMALLCKPKEKR